MSLDQNAFVEAAVSRMKIEFNQLQPDRLPTLKQIMASAHMSYMHLEDIAQDRDQAWERCKARLGIYTGYFSLTRRVPKVDKKYWDRETHTVYDVTLRAIGTSYQEVMDAAQGALREELVKFPAKSEPEGL